MSVLRCSYCPAQYLAPGWLQRHVAKKHPLRLYEQSPAARATRPAPPEALRPPPARYEPARSTMSDSWAVPGLPEAGTRS